MQTECAARPLPLVDRLVGELSERIVSGQLPPGSKITEERIATDCGVSRTPVREAVKRLAELGLIVVRPWSGLEVASVNEQDVKEITELRSHLETLALRLAMERMTLVDLRGLQAAARRCEAALAQGSRESIFREDSRFHLEIARLSRNSYLEDMLRRLDAKVQLCRMFLCLSDAKIKRSVRFHRKILEAMKDGDVPRTESLLRKHIEGISM